MSTTRVHNISVFIEADCIPRARSIDKGRPGETCVTIGPITAFGTEDELYRVLCAALNALEALSVGVGA